MDVNKTEVMEQEVKKAIEEYQCSGCVVGCDTSCFESNPNGGIGCGSHLAGTIIPMIGTIFLGMSKGFNRLGTYTDLKPKIYKTFDVADVPYNKWNIPVWKYLSKDGHTFIRGLMPRRNEPFLHIYLENCMDKINCLEITQEDVDFMD